MNIKEHKLIKEFNSKDILKKLLSQKEIIESCWIWKGCFSKTSGYGRFHFGNMEVRVHRLSYLIFKDKLKKKLVIDHICRNKLCFNPEHLRQVTCRINALENSSSVTALNSKKSECINGHVLIGKNLYIQPKTGFRYCRTCGAIRNLKYKAKRKTKK